MRPIPIYDDTVPITCTLGGAEQPAHTEVIERLRAALDRIERSEHGLLLRFPDRPDVAADLRTFTGVEKGCCAFWGFSVTATDGALTLRWDGPPVVAGLMDRLHEWFEGDAPLTEVAGLP